MSSITLWLFVQFVRALVMAPVVPKQKAGLQKSLVPDWLSSQLSSKGSCFPWIFFCKEPFIQGPSRHSHMSQAFSFSSLHLVHAPSQPISSLYHVSFISESH